MLKIFDFRLTLTLIDMIGGLVMECSTQTCVCGISVFIDQVMLMCLFCECKKVESYVRSF